ncbi:MAG TPA: stalk domain-containing protein, partial [Thermoanaerobaculia bacterium]|nr:stalk domain-containing protein [Thermoanaerobaculia bacterium]
MKDRRIWGLLVFVCLLPVLLAAVQQPAAPPGGTPAPGNAGATRTPSVVLDGAPLPVPVTIAPAGPMFGLRPLAQSLGGELAVDETGESVSLAIADTQVVLGPGSAIVTVGEEIVSLSQPVTGGAGPGGDVELLVPLDFLQKTYGDLLGFAFDWRPETARLVISRRQARDVNVLVDVVHLQGMTTVVLQFAVAPRYDIVRQPGLIEVRMLEDRLAAPVAPPAVQ